MNKMPKANFFQIETIRAGGSQTLQGIFSSANVDRQMWKQLGVFNALGLSAVPESGQLIKLVK